MKYKREQQCKNSKDPNGETEEMGSEKSLDQEQDIDENGTKESSENEDKNKDQTKPLDSIKQEVTGHMSPGVQNHMGQNHQMQNDMQQSLQHDIKKESQIENINEQTIQQEANISQWMTQSAATIPPQVTPICMLHASEFNTVL